MFVGTWKGLMTSTPVLPQGDNFVASGGRKTQTNSCPCHPAHLPHAPPPALSISPLLLLLLLQVLLLLLLLNGK